MNKKIMRINLEMTKRCILNCRMCYAWKNPAESQELTTEEWKKFIGSFGGVLDSDISITFGGGEPLLKEGVLDIVRLCSEKKYETIMPTNGFLIDKKMAQEIVESGLNILYISMDSCRAEIHDYLRGTKGAYYNARKAIDYVAGYRKDNPRIQIGTLITDKNLDDLVKLAVWAGTDKKLFGITFQAIVTPFYSQENSAWYTKSEYLDLWPKDKKKLKSVIEELIKLKKRGFKIWNPEAQLRTFVNYYENPELFIKKGECHLGRNSLSIGSTGEVFLCFLMEPVNNIREFDFAEILQSDRAKNTKEQIKQCKKNCQILINCWFEEE